MAGVAAGLGEWQRAARLLGATAGLLESMGGVLDPDWQADVDRYEAATRSTLGEEAFAEAWAEGQAMSLEQAVEYALHEASDA
jgi:hypothetical protein